MRNPKRLGMILCLSFWVALIGSVNAAEPVESEVVVENQLTVSDIADKEVIGKNGESLGNIKSVIATAEQQFVLLDRAGFLGFGESDITLPTSLLSIIDNQIVAPMISAERAEKMAPIEFSHIQTLTSNDVVMIETR